MKILKLFTFFLFAIFCCDMFSLPTDYRSRRGCIRKTGGKRASSDIRAVFAAPESLTSVREFVVDKLGHKRSGKRRSKKGCDKVGMTEKSEIDRRNLERRSAKDSSARSRLLGLSRDLKAPNARENISKRTLRELRYGCKDLNRLKINGAPEKEVEEFEGLLSQVYEIKFRSNKEKIEKLYNLARRSLENFAFNAQNVQKYKDLFYDISEAASPDGTSDVHDAEVEKYRDMLRAIEAKSLVIDKAAIRKFESAEKEVEDPDFMFDDDLLIPQLHASLERLKDSPIVEAQDLIKYEKFLDFMKNLEKRAIETSTEYYFAELAERLKESPGLDIEFQFDINDSLFDWFGRFQRAFPEDPRIGRYENILCRAKWQGH